MDRGIRSRKLGRGIYPLVVKLVLVALALIVIAAMVVYMRGLVTSTREYFELGPRLYVMYSKLDRVPVLVLYANNIGARSETILRIEIVAGGGKYVCREGIEIEAGFRGYVVIGPNASLPHWAPSGKVVACEWETEGAPELVEDHSYLVRFYTAYHGLMTFIVKCGGL